MPADRSRVTKMAAKTDWRLHPVSTVAYLYLIQTVNAHYCDNDRCTEEEYCCGDNMCCPSYKVWDLWYFWCGVLFFMFLLTVCACLWRYRLLSNGTVVISGYSYTPLQDVNAMHPRPEAVSRFGSGTNQFYIGTPPPYNQVTAGNVKLAGPPPSYAQVVGMRELH